MPLAPISLATQSNPGRNSAISAARLINCYVENAGQEGKIQLPVVACDGFASFAAPSGTGAGGIRAGLSIDASTAYLVSGTKIVKATSGGTCTVLTAAAGAPITLDATALVTIARNRASPPQIAVACGGHYFVIVNDVIADVDLTPLASGTLVSVTANDGYFVLAFDNGEFFVSGIDDFAVDPLSFAKAEANADGLVRGLARSDDVMLGGDRSTEFWKDTGAADFAFERVAAVEYGCYAAGSMSKMPTANGEATDTVIFAATDSEGAYYGVVQISGYSAKKISTTALDRAIRDGGAASTIRGFAWSTGGHIFYTITDLSTYTWSYDLTTGLPHERTSSGLNFWRIGAAFAFAGYNIVGDYTLAKLYRLSPSLYDASNASVLTVKHSNDNGSTWVATRTKTISGSSNLKQRYKFTRLGQSKEDGKVFQMSISKAVMEDGTANDITVQPPAVHAWPNPMRFNTLYVDAIPGVSQTSGTKGFTGLAVDAIAVRG